jgi:hypothetical protein
MTHYRYRIQVGDQYTYRNGSYEMDRVVQDLLDEGVGYDRDAQISRLLRMAKGEDVPEPPESEPVPPEQIRITVEKIRPPRRPEKEKWHKL